MRWLHSITGRLLIAYSVIIIVPFSLLGGFMLSALNQFYVARLQDNMIAEAGLLAQIVAPDMQTGETFEAQYLLDKLPAPVKSQVRVFVFDNSGRLVGSSDPSFNDSLGNALAEPGLEAGAKGQAGRGVEISAATGDPIAYVSQPILNNQQIIGVVQLSYSLQQISAAQTQMRLVIVSVVGITALIASVFGWQLTRNIRQPLARLSAATSTIASGNLAHRVPENVLAELAELSHNFNQMAETLQNAEITRQRSFANIAHDVRTPLGSIHAAIEALDNGALDHPDLRVRLVNGVYEQLHYLRRLTDELLRLASYEGSGLRLKRSRVRLAALVQQVVNAVEVQAAKQAVRLEFTVSNSLPEVWADADRVLEIFFNLLDNALRYTPREGCICIQAEAETSSGRVTIHVRDSGPGVTGPDRSPLFERYWRGDFRRQGSGLNLGLGLSIVQEIVKAHGGTVGVRNLDNSGADFYFTLPIAAP